MSDEPDTHPEQLADELRNFQEIARHIRPSPGEIPTLEGVDIAGLSIPFREVIGGDHIIYIDFDRRYDLDRRIKRAKRKGRDEVAVRLGELRDRGGILLADVSGHRMTDALIGAMLHQAFLLGVHYELDRYGEITTRIFEHINTRFYRTTAVNKYFTMIYGEITSKGRFRFISAGHVPPAVFSREFGRFMTISKERLVSFPPVGLFPSDDDPDEHIEPGVPGYKKRFEVNEIDLLAIGDTLLICTDGLTEHDGGRFFPGAVEHLLDEHAGSSASELCRLLRAAILDAAPRTDDISAIFIRRTR